MERIYFKGYISVQQADVADHALSLAITGAFPGYRDYSLSTSLVPPKPPTLWQRIVNVFSPKDSSGFI